MKFAALVLCCGVLTQVLANEDDDCELAGYKCKTAQCISPPCDVPKRTSQYQCPGGYPLTGVDYYNRYCSGDTVCCPKAGGSGDDPWVEGLAGQHFFFKPKSEESAWYAAVSDPTLQVNLKLTPYDGVSEVDPERDFYTGATIQVFDDDGFAVQSLHIEVHDENKFGLQCQDLDVNAPKHCLGGGALDVYINGVRMLEPGQVHTGEGFDLAAANVIGSCQAVGDVQIRHQPQLQQNRMLQAFDFADFLLRRTIRHPADCERWVTATKRSNNGIFGAAGTKSTLRFETPRLTSVIDFDTHVPTDVSVMPMTYRIGYFMQGFAAHAEGSEGFIGETSTVRFDEAGQPLMTGKVLKGADTMYRVDGPFGRDFEAKHM